jgi:truncated hemoglobin YjbI
MRHAEVPVDDSMAIAWMRCMRAAFDRAGVADDLMEFLDGKLVDLTRFLRNRSG